MIKNRICTIVVNSYDGGEDLWEGFFKCFDANWPDNPFKIVLNTESKTYRYKSLDIQTINCKKRFFNTWALRFKNVLRRINTEYVLVFLDDFWLDKKVNTDYIYKMLNIMSNDQEISCISFRNAPFDNIDDGKYDVLEKRKKDDPYIFNCQVAIWRRERLIKFLRNHESAWDWELYGSNRGKRFKDKFYCIKKNVDEPFIYSEAGVIHRGKWLKEDIGYFSNKYNIKIDVNIRGCETYEHMHMKIKKSSIYEKIFKPRFWSRLFVVIRSHIHKFLSSI